MRWAGPVACMGRGARCIQGFGGEICAKETIGIDGRIILSVIYIYSVVLTICMFASLAK